MFIPGLDVLIYISLLGLCPGTVYESCKIFSVIDIQTMTLKELGRF